MESGCFKHVQKSHLIYDSKINQPPTPLHDITSPWPFSMWVIDAIGSIHSKAYSGYQLILMVADYSTKWV